MGYNKEIIFKTLEPIKSSLFTRAFKVFISVLLFPTAWLLKGYKEKSILWFVLDDKRIGLIGQYSFKYLCFIVAKGGGDETFKIAYLWHIYNPLRNLNIKK
tara:strand:- start:16489 stop:16791 length:303 start_codon:yes stop_codon:yes gene_type:complete